MEPVKKVEVPKTATPSKAAPAQKLTKPVPKEVKAPQPKQQLPPKKIIIQQHEAKKSTLEPGTLYAGPMTVGEFAAAAGVPASEVIIALLEKRHSGSSYPIITCSYYS